MCEKCACICCFVCVCAPEFVCVACRGEKKKNCAMVAYHIIKNTSDSANSVSVRIQITNKCRTLLNRPLAIIAGPARHFQNLWQLPIYLAINPCHVTNRFVTGNDLLSQGYMKWSWPLSDRQELNWPTCPRPPPSFPISYHRRLVRLKKKKNTEVPSTPLTAGPELSSQVLEGKWGKYSTWEKIENWN